MPTMLPDATATMRSPKALPDLNSHRLVLIVGLIFLILAPPIFAVLITSACLGHEQISFSSVFDVFQSAADANRPLDARFCLCIPAQDQ
jgi:hypothetical protein